MVHMIILQMHLFVHSQLIECQLINYKQYVFQQSSNIIGRLLSVCMHGVYCDSRHRSEVYVTLQ